MGDRSLFEQRLAARLEEHLGPRRRVDAHAIAGRAMSQPAGMPARLRNAGLVMPRTPAPALAWLAVVSLLLAGALAATLMAGGSSPRPALVVEPPTPSPSASASPSLSSQPTTPPSGAEVTALVNGFLEARVAGEGAEQYLDVPDDVVFGHPPLLYATTSGAPYERAEFGPVVGYEWPYGFTAFTVRLFAGDTVVEQLVFASAEEPPRLVYVPDGFGTDIAPTTEGGRPVAMPYDAFGGEVTLYVAHPWVFHYDGGPIKLPPEGARPSTDGGERNGWVDLMIIADPERGGESGCQRGPDPADAAALAESIRSDPVLETTTPVALSAGRATGLMMDVTIAAGASTGCSFFVPAPGFRMRLYLFDAPEGSSMGILAIAIHVPDSSFERAVGSGPIGVEFHAP